MVQSAPRLVPGENRRPVRADAAERCPLAALSLPLKENVYGKESGSPDREAEALQHWLDLNA